MEVCSVTVECLVRGVGVSWCWVLGLKGCWYEGDECGNCGVDCRLWTCVKCEGDVCGV